MKFRVPNSTSNLRCHAAHKIKVVLRIRVGSSRTDAAGLERLVDDLIVTELAIESLGAPGSETGTYLDLIVTNARRIADSLEN